MIQKRVSQASLPIEGKVEARARLLTFWRLREVGLWEPPYLLTQPVDIAISSARGLYSMSCGQLISKIRAFPQVLLWLRDISVGWGISTRQSIYNLTESSLFSDYAIDQ